MSNTFAGKFYLHDEVVIHNELDDAWVVLNNKVLNISHLFKNVDSIYDGTLLLELLRYVGKNISDFFDENGQPLERISYSGKKHPLLAATLVESTADQSIGSTLCTFWWNNPRYEIGFVTRQERIIRIVNTLTHSSTILTVCDEDTVHVIQRKHNERFRCLNQNYVWRKYNCNATAGCLDETKTLIENGFSFEGQPYGVYPAIWLYYISDFKTLRY